VAELTLDNRPRKAVKKVAGPAMKREAVRVAREEAGLSAKRL